MKLASTIRFADKKTQDAFYSLRQGDDSERELFKIINQAMDNLEDDAFCGIQVPKRLIPKLYSVSNLWKYDLPKGWRLLYSIVDEEIIVISVILEWLSHKDYEKRFRY